MNNTMMDLYNTKTQEISFFEESTEISKDSLKLDVFGNATYRIKKSLTFPYKFQDLSKLGNDFKQIRDIVSQMLSKLQSVVEDQNIFQNIIDTDCQSLMQILDSRHDIIKFISGRQNILYQMIDYKIWISISISYYAYLIRTFDTEITQLKIIQMLHKSIVHSFQKYLLMQQLLQYKDYIHYDLDNVHDVLLLCQDPYEQVYDYGFNWSTMCKIFTSKYFSIYMDKDYLVRQEPKIHKTSKLMFFYPFDSTNIENHKLIDATSNDSNTLQYTQAAINNSITIQKLLNLHLGLQITTTKKVKQQKQQSEQQQKQDSLTEQDSTLFTLLQTSQIENKQSCDDASQSDKSLCFPKIQTEVIESQNEQQDKKSVTVNLTQYNLATQQNQIQTTQDNNQDNGMSNKRNKGNQLFDSSKGSTKSKKK